MKPRILFIFLIIPLLFSCKEVYYPDLNSTNKILVVSGIITNQHKTHSISLSWAKSFNDKDDLEPVKGAQVYITDKRSENYYFVEGDCGIYYSDTILFVPQIGNAYKLTIVLDDGVRYESDYQDLLEENALGEISGNISNKDFIIEVGDNTIVQSYDGVEALVSIAAAEGVIPKHRFDVELLIQYVWNDDGMISNTHFCWVTYNPNNNVNITSSKYDVNVNGMIFHSMCFLPQNSNYWNIEHAYSCFIIFIDAYRLNDASYSFYKKAHDQLAADNSIFDPITVQLPCNIKCITDSGRPVLGFFEASNVSSFTFIIQETSPSSVRFINSPDFPRGFEKSGYSINVMPSFWYTNYINK
ncbi:hypothetical protein CYCD_02770 [Tenuifilaceae bacterium CYCD]|nr:hypothetical protein CYCD_02770 [Tenuifilaceae bacterium CYCD]